MNIRRGFNRLSVAVYVLWLVALILALWIETSSTREYYNYKLRSHEWASESLEGRDEIYYIVTPSGKTTTRQLTSEEVETLRSRDYQLTPTGERNIQELLEAEGKGTIGPKGRSLLIDLRESGQIPSGYLLREEVQEYSRKRDEATVPRAMLAAFSGWTGWTLVLFLPGGLYLSCLAVGYTLRWVYRGFAGKGTG